MLAERRDFTVATYSSARGTGARLIVSTFTGNGCAAGAFASVLLHPVLIKAAANATGARTVSLMYFRIARSIGPNAYQEKMPGARDEIQNLIWYDSNPPQECSFLGAGVEDWLASPCTCHSEDLQTLRSLL